MKTLVASTIVVLGLLSAGAASADQYVGNACVQKKTGAVRFVDGLKANKQKCKSSEEAANYRKEGKIYDSAGQFIGYGSLDQGSDPYNLNVFVPALGQSVSIRFKYQKVTDPATKTVSLWATDPSQGEFAYYEEGRQSYYAQANCQGQEYYFSNSGLFRDPQTDAVLQHKEAPVAITVLSYKQQYWDWTRSQWVADPHSCDYDPVTGECTGSPDGCRNKEPDAAPSIYRPYQPTPVTVPFGAIKLPLVQK